MTIAADRGAYLQQRGEQLARCGVHFLVWLVFACVTGLAYAQQQPRIATFEVDATPPIGSPLCDALVAPAKEIVDRLTARGIILLTDQQPIVLCSVDWVGIGNEGHDEWREALAEAAETSVDRVTVHTVHQHDAPGCDFSAEAILREYGLRGVLFDVEFARQTLGRVKAAIKQSLEEAERVTHIGLGSGVVEKVASNRRVLGEDGKVQYVRYSSCRIPEAIAAPEGVIDPNLRSISFWDDDRLLTVMTFYATHPQSYYGQGGVSADFVGIARRQREFETTGVRHIHFNGAGGNVAAGKYNDGSPELRPILAARLASGMQAAHAAEEREPIGAADVDWSFAPVALPVRETLVQRDLLQQIQDPQLVIGRRCQAARELAFLRRAQAGHQINVNCLSLGGAKILFLPGELFVEYQLAAQQMAPDSFVAMAAYGDYGPGYIGTQIAYGQGGYETGRASRTDPAVERVLMTAMKSLLGVK